uniref:non-specific serine/threonine protein kinase n=1 Tax=Timema tahoe TaxID=61484 RepID=A0A7R9INL8_9NEOP|nr:unnamed protein product [Timema tahoe]
MNLDMLTIMELRREMLRGNSPTDELLTLWGHQNHTVEELFVLLSQMQHYQAMIVLKTFVSSRFHSLIYEGEEYMRNLFGTCGSKPSFDDRGGEGQEPNSELPVTAPSVENQTSGRTHGDTARANLSKNIGFGAHNMNVTGSTVSLPNKMVFPPQAPSERKVLNAMANSTALPPPLSPAGAQQSIREPPRVEDKENAALQTTKLSSLLNGLFPLGLPVNTKNKVLDSPIRVACFAHRNCTVAILHHHHLLARLPTHPIVLPRRSLDTSLKTGAIGQRGSLTQQKTLSDVLTLQSVVSSSRRMAVYKARIGGLSRSRTPVVLEICLTGACDVNTSRDVLVVEIVFPAGWQDSRSQLLSLVSSIRIDFTSPLGTSVAGSPRLVRLTIHSRTRDVSNASSIVDNCANVPEIEHEELKLATNNWDKSCIIGKGGFGTVFKGKWKHILVAIKRIEQVHGLCPWRVYRGFVLGEGVTRAVSLERGGTRAVSLERERGAESVESYKAHIEQSMHELRMLNSCRHDNILPVYGYCIKGGDPCLVYQLMPNGSLEDRLLSRVGTIILVPLNGTKPLTWPQRHNIAEGTARGLHFLHTNKPKPFIHGDVKSANILLDSNFEPRIGDFGLAQVGPAGQYTHMTVSRVHGTRPYLPDEFLRSKVLSTKVDTFSFGIVMFELATGLRPYDELRQHKFLKDYMCEVEESQLPLLVDKRAVPDDPALFDGMVQLGKTCVNKRHRERPEMEEVLTRLQGMCPIPVPQVCRQLSPNSSHPNYYSQQRRLSSPNPSSLPPLSLNPSWFPLQNTGGSPLPFPVNIVEPVGMNYQFQPLNFPPPQGYYPPSPLNPFLEGLPRLSVQQEEEEESEGPSGRFYRPRLSPINHPQVQRTVSPVVTNHLQFSPGNAQRSHSPAAPGVVFHRPMIQPSSYPVSNNQPALPIPALRLQRTESRSDSAFLPVCLLNRSSTESSLSSSKEQEELSNGQDDVTPNEAGLPFVSELALPLISELGIKDGGGTTALGKALAL